MIDLMVVRQLASTGMTKTAVAKQLGTTRQVIWKMAKTYSIEFSPVQRNPHLHGEGRRPTYRKGCEDCRALMRDWYYTSKTRRDT